jgi:translocation and assembly module TamB
LLLTGRSLSSASESDANMLINAVAALGIERGQGITRQIAQTFNLDEIKIQAGGGFEEGSLLLGKHLSPRLYIQYVVGFLNQAGQLNLEYRLTENLKLEARSGEERSMDLMYKIER